MLQSIVNGRVVSMPASRILGGIRLMFLRSMNIFSEHAQSICFFNNTRM